MVAIKLLLQHLSLILFIGASLLCFSCRINGLTDGYKRLSPEDREAVSYLSLGEKQKPSPILMLNGKALLERLDDNSYNVVYLFSPHCKSLRCISINGLKNKIAGRAKLYVVACYPTPQLIEQGRQEQIYGLDRYYYGTKYLFRMYKPFFDELTSRIDTDKDTTDIYIFKGKQYLGTTNHTGLEQFLRKE